MAIALATMHSQVVRLTGVIDRFGSYESIRVPSRHSQRYQQRRWVERKTVPTVCVRNLRLAQTRQAVTPDHWWLHLRQEWAQLGLQPGDVVLFTTKIHRCQKGYQGEQVALKNSEVRVEYGPSRNVRQVTVISRSQLLSRYQQAQAEKQSLLVELEQLKQGYQADQQRWQQTQTEKEALKAQLTHLNQAYDSDQTLWQQSHTDLQTDLFQVRQILTDYAKQNQALSHDVRQLEQQLTHSWPKKHALGLVGLTAVAAFTGGILWEKLPPAPPSPAYESSLLEV